MSEAIHDLTGITINEETRLFAEWYDLAAACRLKGISKKTAQNQPWLQPNGGVFDAVVGRRKRWHRETIQQWLLQCDEDLLERRNRDEKEVIA